jgi:hypothetical protein
MKQGVRIDYMPFPGDGPDGEYMVEPMKKTDEGYLRGRAIVTNVGVFPYVMADGTVMWELRPPEEVFNRESRDSLSKVPITNDHPIVPVDSENAKSLQVGFTGNVVQDQYYLSSELTITDKQAVEDVEGGKRALSAGYTVDLEMKSGIWMGVPYDAIQRNIRYNHVAIVPKGRAGDAAKMKLDSLGPVGVRSRDFHLDSFQVIEKKSGRSESMKKITIDGVEYEADDGFIRAYQDQSKELSKVKANADTIGENLEAVKKDLSTVSAERDQLKEDTEALKKEKEALEKIDHSAAIAEGIKQKRILLDAAEKAGVEVKEDQSDDDLKKEIILKVYPGAKEKLDGADAVYLAARFDGAIEALEAKPASSAFTGDVPGAGQKTDGAQSPAGDPNMSPAEKARLDMIERQKNKYSREV